MSPAKKTALDLDHEVDTYPAVIRRRIMRCLVNVEKLARAEGLEADVPRLRRQYRSTKATMTGASLPFSLKLWVALDRLEQAFADRRRFDPEDYDSGPVARAVLDRLHGYVTADLPQSALKRKVTKRQASRFVVKLLNRAELATDHLSRSEIDEEVARVVRQQGVRDAERRGQLAAGPTAAPTAAKLIQRMYWDESGELRLRDARNELSEFEVALLVLARELAYVEIHSPAELVSASIDSAVGSARRAGPAKELNDGADSKAQARRRRIWEYLVASGLHTWKRGEGKGHKIDAQAKFKVGSRTVDAVIEAGRRGDFDKPS